MVQEHSMESRSLDNSEPNSIQMNRGAHPEQEQHSMNSNSSSQNINLGPNAPTSFSRDMFPQNISEQNQSETVSLKTLVNRHFMGQLEANNIFNGFNLASSIPKWYVVICFRMLGCHSTMTVKIMLLVVKMQ